MLLSLLGERHQHGMQMENVTDDSDGGKLSIGEEGSLFKASSFALSICDFTSGIAVLTCLW